MVVGKWRPEGELSSAQLRVPGPEIDARMVMRARAMGLSSIRREVLVSAAFTALLVASILLLPSLLLTGTGTGTGGPSRRWPFLSPSTAAAGEKQEQEQARYPVRFAYLISASTGDASRAARLLAALYHPANSYLVHLDREAPAEEHRRLAELVSGSGRGVYARAGNVWVVGRPNLVTYRGPTMLTTTLHAVAVLLRLRRRWDWFINLSASDYPLVTQDGTVILCFLLMLAARISEMIMLACWSSTESSDSEFGFADLMEAFAGLPRDLNFIQHTSHLGWKM